MKISIVLLSSLLFLSFSCGKQKVQEGKEESSEEIPATEEKKEEKTADAQPAADKPPVAPAAPAAPPINVAEVLSKTTWTVFTQFTNNKAYTGFDGTNPFRFILVAFPRPDLSKEVLSQVVDSPEFLAAYKAELAKITIELDPLFLAQTELKGEEFIRAYVVNSIAAGSTIAKAKLGATEKAVTVAITAYTPAQVALGRTRYSTAVAGATPSPACISCHRVQNAPNHSPLHMSKFTDAGLLSSIEAGTNSDDGYVLKAAHKQTFISPEERAGMVPYLRTLDPLAAGNLEIPAPVVTPAAP